MLNLYSDQFFFYLSYLNTERRKAIPRNSGAALVMDLSRIRNQYLVSWKSWCTELSEEFIFSKGDALTLCSQPWSPLFEKIPKTYSKFTITKKDPGNNANSSGLGDTQKYKGNKCNI